MKHTILFVSLLFVVMFLGVSCKKSTQTCKTCGWASTQGGDIVEGSHSLCDGAITDWEAQAPKVNTATVKSVTKYPVCK